MSHPNISRIEAELRARPEPLIQWAARIMVMLGAKREWSMEDNFQTTESLARLADNYGLPSVGNQDDDDLEFYGQAALALGYSADIGG